MFKSNRVLFINSFSGYSLPNYQQISSLDQLHNILERYGSLEVPIDLTLDVRGLSNKVLSSFLVFLESYSGKVILVVCDPVLPTILSRFIEVYKFPEIDKQFTYNNYFLKNTSKFTKEKIEILLS